MSALYLPVIFFAIVRGKGQELTAGPVILYALVGAGLGIFEAFCVTGVFRNWMLSRSGISKFMARWFWLPDDDHSLRFMRVRRWPG